jgi:hypothetical protein
LIKAAAAGLGRGNADMMRTPEFLQSHAQSERGSRPDADHGDLGLVLTARFAPRMLDEVTILRKLP